MSDTEHPPDWYIVCTRSQQERAVYDALQRKGFAVYLPIEVRVIRPGNTRQVVARPLFPRYLFAMGRPQFDFAEVLKTNHVMWFVTNAEKRVRIRDPIIAALKEAESAGLFDQTQPKPKTPIPFKVGDKVTLKAGSFAGLIAEIAACPSEKRIKLLIPVMGRKVAATTPLANLERLR